MEPVRSFTLATGTRSARTAEEQLFSWNSSQSIDHSLVLANVLSLTRVPVSLRHRGPFVDTIKDPDMAK